MPAPFHLPVLCKCDDTCQTCGLPRNEDQILQIIPASGWKYRVVFEDGSHQDCALVAWALTRDGMVQPVHLEGDTYAWTMRINDDQLVGIFHESEDTRWLDEATTARARQYAEKLAADRSRRELEKAATGKPT